MTVVYFVSYNFKVPDGSSGFGSCVLYLERRVTTVADTEELKATIESVVTAKHPAWKGVNIVILSFQVLTES